MRLIRKRVPDTLVKPLLTQAEKDGIAIDKYLAGDRVPFDEGYAEYRNRFLLSVFADPALMRRFRHGSKLPAGYGVRMDERTVEYPWVLSHLKDRSTHLLDAGATLIFPFLLDLPLLQAKTMVVYTLAPEKWIYQLPNVSYIYGDLRDTILKDGLFQEIVCLSTLDHVGMDNTKIYSEDSRFCEQSPREYRLVLQELRRLLAPGGRLLITVPYGRYANLGWMQQFDAPRLQDLIDSFDGKVAAQTLYKYQETGWQVASAEECADSVYFDIHSTPEIESDGAAAARAVACVEMVCD